MSTRTNEGNWLSLLDRLSLASNPTVHTELLAAYSGVGRHYHTLSHIDDCLEQLEACGLPEETADPIALAIWFHDAIYNWRSQTNEADSARWAREFLSKSNAPTILTNHVEDLIMATCHFAPEPLDGDRALIADIDLSILGRVPQEYDRYEKAIQNEYRMVPKAIYRRERRKVLCSFLERPRIFLTDRFIEFYEAPARNNLTRTIRSLKLLQIKRSPSGQNWVFAM